MRAAATGAPACSAASSTWRPSSSMSPVSSASGDEHRRAGAARARGAASARAPRRPTIRAGGERDDRLVVDDELAAVERPPQVAPRARGDRRRRRASRARRSRSGPCPGAWPCTWRGRRCAAAGRCRCPASSKAMPMLAPTNTSVPAIVERLAGARRGCARRRRSPRRSSSRSSRSTANSSPPEAGRGVAVAEARRAAGRPPRRAARRRRCGRGCR